MILEEHGFQETTLDRLLSISSLFNIDKNFDQSEKLNLTRLRMGLSVNLGAATTTLATVVTVALYLLYKRETR